LYNFFINFKNIIFDVIFKDKSMTHINNNKEKLKESIMKIFQTNAALGYRQLAFLIRLDKSENGYNYLCIGTQNINDSDMYQVGKVVEDLEDFYLEETSFKLTDSELNGNYLFDYWVSHYYA
jgi:hypothetical protein